MDQSRKVELVEAMLDRDRFIAWLMERSEELVGRASHLFDCPVARFLRDAGVEAWVGAVTFGVGEVRVEEQYYLPGWAVDFVAALDRSVLWRKVEVTGEWCLEVLARLGGGGDEQEG